MREKDLERREISNSKDENKCERERLREKRD